MPAIDDQTFLKYALQAEVAAESGHADYWYGYRRGLHRNFYGDEFCTDGEHQLWLTFGLADDPEATALGRGYRDGFAGLEPQVPWRARD